jgi:predicted O-methyltransferase YrrM
VSSRPLDDDLEVVDRGHERSAVDPDRSDRELVPEVKADRGADALENPLRHARACPAGDLLGRLKQKANGTGGASNETRRDRERDRNVSIVPARVHPAGRLRGEVHAARFRDREAVQVGSHEEAGPVFPEIGDDAGLRDSGARLDPETPETFGDSAGGSRLAKCELRVAVKVPASLDQILHLTFRESSEKIFEVIRAGRHAGILQKPQQTPRTENYDSPVVPLVSPELDRYLIELLPERDPVISEMEAYAKERDVPIVGPAVATLLSMLARSIAARRICELGSAIGYSTAFFARAVGSGGKVVYTDGSESNAKRAREYLARLGLLDRVEMRVGEAVATLQATSGDFDVVFIDIDKDGYPKALDAAAPRVRPGGYLLADNVLWSGKVVDPAVRDAATEGIREFNRRLFARRDFESVIVPLRDGVAIARRVES